MSGSGIVMLLCSTTPDLDHPNYSRYERQNKKRMADTGLRSRNPPLLLAMGRSIMA